jgi:hypothetical protein
MASLAIEHETKNTTMSRQMKLAQKKFQFEDLVMVV